MRHAPAATSRSTSASMGVSGPTSRCTRFLTVFGSGTGMKRSVGPDPGRIRDLGRIDAVFVEFRVRKHGCPELRLPNRVTAIEGDTQHAGRHVGPPFWSVP